MENTTYATALIAIFANRESAESARDQLTRAGIRQEQIVITGAGNSGSIGRQHDDAEGGISGFLHRLFGGDTNQEDRAYYSEATRDGRYTVVVHANEDSIDRATEILNRSGAVQVESESDRSGSEYASAQRDYPERSEERGQKQNTGAPIPVVNEEVRVGKRAVQRGGVRVYSQINEQPVEEKVALREEHIRVERRPVDREATQEDFEAGSRGVIEVMETAEEPVIEKRARVVEEIVVNKDVTQREENVRDTVRRTDVRVEDAQRGNAGSTVSDYDTDFRNDFRSRYGDSGRYEDYAPAYRYGYEMASDERYRGRNFNDVERDIQADYVRRNPNSTWERMKDAVRYGWEKVTGRR
jgi:uncharacterized protein (TIGR02271 family)